MFFLRLRLFRRLRRLNTPSLPACLPSCPAGRKANTAGLPRYVLGLCPASIRAAAARLCSRFAASIRRAFFRCFAHLRIRAPSLNGGQTAVREQFRAQNSEPRFQSTALLTQKSDLSAWIGRALRASEINSCEKRLLWVKRRRFMRRRFFARALLFFVDLQKDV